MKLLKLVLVLIVFAGIQFGCSQQGPIFWKSYGDCQYTYLQEDSSLVLYSDRDAEECMLSMIEKFPNTKKVSVSFYRDSLDANLFKRWNLSSIYIQGDLKRVIHSEALQAQSISLFHSGEKKMGLSELNFLNTGIQSLELRNLTITDEDVLKLNELKLQHLSIFFTKDAKMNNQEQLYVCEKLKNIELLEFHLDAGKYDLSDMDLQRNEIDTLNLLNYSVSRYMNTHRDTISIGLPSNGKIIYLDELFLPACDLECVVPNHLVYIDPCCLDLSIFENPELKELDLYFTDRFSNILSIPKLQRTTPIQIYVHHESNLNKDIFLSLMEWKKENKMVSVNFYFKPMHNYHPLN